MKSGWPARLVFTLACLRVFRVSFLQTTRVKYARFALSLLTSLIFLFFPPWTFCQDIIKFAKFSNQRTGGTNANVSKISGRKGKRSKFSNFQAYTENYFRQKRNNVVSYFDLGTIRQFFSRGAKTFSVSITGIRKEYHFSTKF